MRTDKSKKIIATALVALVLLGTGVATAQNNPVPPPASLPAPATDNRTAQMPPSQALQNEASPGLVEVERILGYPGLDRLYLRYRQIPGLYPSFGAYMLNYSARRVNGARRLSRLGNALMIVGGAITVLGVAWAINSVQSDEPQHSDDDYYYDGYGSAWEGFDTLLAGVVIMFGAQVLAGGVICKVIGVRKIRQYSEWQRRLGEAMMDPYARQRSRWQGIGLQVSKERLFVGTGVSF